jgi:hypothetical protein
MRLIFQFFVYISSEQVPYSTAILSANSRKYSLFKNQLPLSTIRGATDFKYEYKWYGELQTSFISNTKTLRITHMGSSWLRTLKRQNTEISKQIFLEKEYRGLSPNFHIHASVSDSYIPTISLPILLEEICRPIMGLYKSLTDTWLWKLGLRPCNSQKRNT